MPSVLVMKSVVLSAGSAWTLKNWSSKVLGDNNLFKGIVSRDFNNYFSAIAAKNPHTSLMRKKRHLPRPLCTYYLLYGLYIKYERNLFVLHIYHLL